MWLLTTGLEIAAGRAVVGLPGQRLEGTMGRAANRKWAKRAERFAAFTDKWQGRYLHYLDLFGSHRRFGRARGRIR
jgi:hypothetical protein